VSRCDALKVRLVRKKRRKKGLMGYSADELADYQRRRGDSRKACEGHNCVGGGEDEGAIVCYRLKRGKEKR